MKIDQQTTLKPNNKNSSCNYDAKRQEYFDNLRKNIEDLQKMLNDLTMKVDGFGTEFNTKEINTVSLSAGDNITTKDLYVNGKATLHGTTEVNDLNVNGSISVVKELIANLLRVTDLYVNNADLNEADINSAIIETLKIKREILRFDTNQEIISFPEEHVTQLGDIANSILLAGLERPTWNGSPLALTSDLSTGLTPNYKGMIDTEDELPPTASIGDFYLIKKVIRKTESGLGSAIYGVSEKWEVTLYYELLNYFNKEEITQLFDDELLDDIQRETDIIKGNTPVQKVANGCVNVAGELLATTDDAFMLSGPEGMDNIKENSSLDELIVCGQYSADDALARTIQDKPEGENSAFDIAVGLFSGDKNNIYQLYTGKETQKLYFRIGLNKAFNGWQEIAYINGTTPVDVANKLLTHGEIPSFDLPNDYGNKVVQYNGGATNSPGAATNGEAMTFTKTGSQQAIVAFDNTKNDMYYKTQFGDWKEWQKVAVQDSNGYVSKALLAEGLEANATMDDKKVATTDGTIENAKHIKNQRTLHDESLNDVMVIGKYIIKPAGAKTVTDGPKWLNEKAFYATLLVLDWEGGDRQQILIGGLGGVEGHKNAISIRFNAQGSTTAWGAWQELVTTDNVFTADGGYLALIDSLPDMDFNNCPLGTSFSNRGNFLNLKNAPPKDDSYTVWTFKTNGTKSEYKRQIAYGRDYDTMFSRIKTNTWSTWQQLATTETAIPFFPDTPEMRVNNDLFALPAGTYFWNESVPKNAPKMLPNGRINKIKRGSSGMISVAYTDNNEMYFTYDRQPWKQVATVGAKTLQTYNAGITKEV